MDADYEGYQHWPCARVGYRVLLCACLCRSQRKHQTFCSAMPRTSYCPLHIYGALWASLALFGTTFSETIHIHQHNIDQTQKRQVREELSIASVGIETGFKPSLNNGPVNLWSGTNLAELYVAHRRGADLRRHSPNLAAIQRWGMDLLTASRKTVGWHLRQSSLHYSFRSYVGQQWYWMNFVKSPTFFREASIDGRFRLLDEPWCLCFNRSTLWYWKVAG